MPVQISTSCPAFGHGILDARSRLLLLAGGAAIAAFLAQASLAQVILIIALMGLVGLLEKLSIARCPTAVLMGAAIFIVTSVIVDVVIF